MKQTLDFIVIGAQKSGTTTLFDYLSQHPALELPADKEAPFFSDDARFTRGMPEYLARVFSFGDPTKLWGTVTPQYMGGGLLGSPPGSVPQQDDPPEITVPERIRAVCPDALLIALLRDPTERAFSHYRHAVLLGWEQRPFEQAIEGLLQPDALRTARQLPCESAGYVVWGEYGRILAPYVDLFGKERVLVAFTDELASNPMALMARIYTFLGVDPASAAEATRGPRARAGATRRRLAWLNLFRAQIALARNGPARALWHAAPWRTRRKIDQLFARAALSVELWNRQPEQERMPSEVAAALRDHFRDDTQRLVDLTGCVPPWADGSLPSGDESTPASQPR